MDTFTFTTSVKLTESAQKALCLYTNLPNVLSHPPLGESWEKAPTLIGPDGLEIETCRLPGWFSNRADGQWDERLLQKGIWLADAIASRCIHDRKHANALKASEDRMERLQAQAIFDVNETAFGVALDIYHHLCLAHRALKSYAER